MAEAGRRPSELPGEPAGPEAAGARESEAPAPPPALRGLPGDPSPRGRSQSDLSSCSSRGRPLRVHISGSARYHGAENQRDDQTGIMGLALRHSRFSITCFGTLLHLSSISVPLYRKVYRRARLPYWERWTAWQCTDSWAGGTGGAEIHLCPALAKLCPSVCIDLPQE
ncbi:Collagen Alpha-5(Vi) Chain [Manis pentadactyla]|nr:Collagen Alpha-5(Vi) Chain [Manis pentadactyla]